MPVRNWFAVKTATSSFTFSLRFRYSASTSGSGTVIQPVSAACSFSAISWLRSSALEFGLAHRRALRVAGTAGRRLGRRTGRSRWNSGIRSRRSRSSPSMTVMPEPVRLGEDRLVVDELLDHALRQMPSCLQHLVVELTAVGGADLRELLRLYARWYWPTVILRPFDGRRSSRSDAAPTPRICRQLGIYSSDERRHDDHEAPLQPALCRRIRSSIVTANGLLVAKETIMPCAIDKRPSAGRDGGSARRTPDAAGIVDTLSGRTAEYSGPNRAETPSISHGIVLAVSRPLAGHSQGYARPHAERPPRQRRRPPVLRLAVFHRSDDVQDHRGASRARQDARTGRHLAGHDVDGASRRRRHSLGAVAGGRRATAGFRRSSKACRRRRTASRRTRRSSTLSQTIGFREHLSTPVRLDRRRARAGLPAVIDLADRLDAGGPKLERLSRRTEAVERAAARGERVDRSGRRRRRARRRASATGCR